MSDSTVSERGELEEAGWAHEAVTRMSDDQVKLAYEAEGDRNHEAASGERKLWEHEIGTAVIVNEQVVELDDDAVALIAAMFDADRHPGQIEASDETWAKVRAVFAPALAPAEDAVGFTRITA